MANQDLLKQAIAEAKAIREAAISNAKDVMEESLTPHIKDMLAAKLQEMEAEDMDETVEEGSYEDDMDEAKHDDDMDEAKHDKDMEEVVAEEEDEPAEDDAEESEDEAEEEAEEGEEAEEIEDMDVEDLKNLIRDIIAQEMGGGMEDGMDDMEDMTAGDEEGGVEDMVATDDEEINLEELLAELESLAEGEDEVDEAKHDDEDTMEEAKHDDDMEEGKYKEKEMEESAELNEALQTVETLRKELSEVNLLNSKLLYVNKIFKAHNLSEAQKVNIITTFDKAETVKEVKLVYETVSENIGSVKSEKSQIKEHKSFASKATGNSTKGEVISEVSEQVRRMQKLAGIIK